MIKYLGLKLSSSIISHLLLLMQCNERLNAIQTASRSISIKCFAAAGAAHMLFTQSSSRDWLKQSKLVQQHNWTQSNSNLTRCVKYFSNPCTSYIHRYSGEWTQTCSLPPPPILIQIGNSKYLQSCASCSSGSSSNLQPPFTFLLFASSSASWMPQNSFLCHLW